MSQFDPVSFQEEAHRLIAQVEDYNSLNSLKGQILGKSSQLTLALKGLKEMQPEARKQFASKVQESREHVQRAFEAKRAELDTAEFEKKLQAVQIQDLSLARTSGSSKRLHPISIIIQEMASIFENAGFEHRRGPEIEDEFHNFTALNIEEDHPARDSHDTFFLKNHKDKLLRTHTSPVQIRRMLTGSLPVYMICTGKVYRNDHDITHTPMFHQMEGLAVDIGKPSFAHLKYSLAGFFESFFQTQLKTRFRPSFFPFTEPSLEVDISCFFCEQSGCRICKQSGWIEVAGAGMVHPNVLQHCKIDPSIYQGFAFGMGVERLAMLKLGIDDIRLLYESNIDFLQS